MASILQQIFQRSQAPSGAVRYTLSMSMPVFCTLVTIFLLITVWSFYLGYMVGRGQNPERHLTEIAAILQAHQKEHMPVPQQEAPVQAADAVPAQQESAPAAEAAASLATAAAAVQPDAATQTVQPPKPAAQPERKQQVKEPRYAYTFQLATLRSEQSAKQAAANAAKRGIRTSVQKSGKGWVITASVRGTEKDAQNLRAQSKAVGLASPMLISRKELR